MTRARALAGLVVALALATSACGAWKRFAYSGPGRDDWQQPERVVAALALAPGARVADLGAGGGYFTFRLADAVGPSGVVYAVDVDPDMLSYLRERAAAEKRANVVVIDAAYDDPRLPDGDVDLVLVVNTYHHLRGRIAYFGRVKRALRPGGRLAIIELAEGGFPAGHFTSPEVIRDELEAAGYALAAQHDFLERQSFLVFTPSP
jgi:ubiquinone/menaquinone biosynthesis C-methylase UbiE